MTQAELDRAVSRATGESMGTIRRQGFSILPLTDDVSDDEPNILPLQTRAPIVLIRNRSKAGIMLQPGCGKELPKSFVASPWHC